MSDPIEQSPAQQYVPAIQQFREAQQAAGCELHSLTVVKDGVRLVEFGVAPWTLERASLVYSMSKTFTSAAFGIARERGLLSEDDLVIDLFPEHLDDRVGPKARTITLGHCLSMASGHTFDTIELFNGRWTLDSSGIGEFLRHEPDGTPGETFCYNQLCTYTVALAVARATGTSVHDLMRREVLDKLDCEPSWWASDPDGNAFGFSGNHVSPRTLASFIGLVANGGVAVGGAHDGEQLLPQGWIDQYAIKRVENAAANPSPDSDWAQGYGWQVWRGRDGGHRADGAYGQYGLIWPDQKLAVVITSLVGDMQVTIDQVRQILLPALDSLEAPEPAAIVPVPTGSADFAAWSGTIADRGAARVASDGDGWLIAWSDPDGGEHRIPVGHGHWRDSVMRWDGSSLDVSAAGAVDESGVLRVRLACLNTPHTALLDFPGDTDRGSFSWNAQPLGEDTLKGISLPDGWDR
ncbi:serine hydrolase domain-containing protein [Aestuariimicrobium kwangyangense]|uniref:serine hydrolase domain-containing protein n=1 Tax=Aestuariimicrobium kwangyangense TaxID=396389 RepID=UPI0003B47473|nr:serine hydrolase [Aestuariimicrobium kwangyangense]